VHDRSRRRRRGIEILRRRDLPFDLAVSEQQGRVPRHVMKAFVDVAIQDQVRVSGFVFQGHEHHAAGGAGLLPASDQACHRDTPAARRLLELGRGEHLLRFEPRAQVSHRMIVDTEPLTAVVEQKLLDLAERRKFHRRLFPVDSREYPVRSRGAR
jgi:hypothetical protein